MRPPRAPGVAVATRPPWLLLGLLCLVPLAVAFATPVADFEGGPQGDVPLYLGKARGVMAGLAPYRDIPLEYPPLALLPMTLPFALWPFGSASLNVYAWLFAGQQAVLLLALGLVAGRIVGLGGAWGLLAGAREGGVGAEPADAHSARQRRVALRLLLLASGAALAITWRFDLFPVLLLAVAVWASLENRPVAAGVVIGIGVLAKLFPLVAAPALAVAWLAPVDVRRLARFAMAILFVVVVGLAPFVALAGPDALTFLAYQVERGLQIESTGGAPVLLSGLIGGEPIALRSPFSAQEVTGGLAAVLLAVTSVLAAVVYALLAWLGWRRVRDDAGREGGVSPATIVTLAAASILVLIATSKVFSIQYVVWLLPFAAFLPRRQFWLAAVMVGLSMPIHPLLYDELVAQRALPILVLNLRNALLVVLLALVLRDLARPAGLEPTTFRSAT